VVDSEHVVWLVRELAAAPEAAAAGLFGGQLPWRARSAGEHATFALGFRRVLAFLEGSDACR
jgi:hypothetical protein